MALKKGNIKANSVRILGVGIGFDHTNQWEVIVRLGNSENTSLINISFSLQDARFLTETIKEVLNVPNANN